MQNGANEVSAPAEVAAITAMAVKGARIRSGTLAADGPALLDGELAARLFGREDEQARRRGLAGATGRPSAQHEGTSAVPEAYVIGVGIGTTGTKAVVVGEDGRVVARSAAVERPTAYPSGIPGAAEQDPDDLVGGHRELSA